MSASELSEIDIVGIGEAYKQAVTGATEGGIPIGSALVYYRKDVSVMTENTGPEEEYKILGAGRNERVQQGSAVLHAEIAALANAGRLKAEVYRNSTIVSSYP